jgi:superfamily I DNA/RNA helicase
LQKISPSPEGADAIQIITIHKAKRLAFRAVFVTILYLGIIKQKPILFWVSAKDTAYHRLGDIPLRFSESLARTTVARAYFEELLYSNMDSLNMLYVATTWLKIFYTWQPCLKRSR